MFWVGFGCVVDFGCVLVLVFGFGIWWLRFSFGWICWFCACFGGLFVGAGLGLVCGLVGSVVICGILFGVCLGYDCCLLVTTDYFVGFTFVCCWFLIIAAL